MQVGSLLFSNTLSAEAAGMFGAATVRLSVAWGVGAPEGEGGVILSSLMVAVYGPDAVRCALLLA